MSDLNVLLIQIDSLNRHFLACYGNEWVETPALDAFAAKGVVFENHFVGSLPCMPARREIWAGVEEHWWRTWGPVEPWDVTLAEHAGRSGVRTGLVTDHFHLFEWGGYGYVQDFDSWQFIRGHARDPWRADDPVSVPDWAEVMAERWAGPFVGAVEQYLRNIQGFEREEHFFGPQVMAGVAEWLERNAAGGRFYLHVDSFDVHEPFHVPEPYRSLYSDDDYRRYSPWPHYGRTDDGNSALEPEEIAWVRAQFAGKLTMVDRWLGRVFDTLEDKQLWDRTAVIVTTDHGHYLGEHGWIGKPAAPLYDTLCRIPLLAWLPGGSGGTRTSAITQTVDVHATVLDLLGSAAPDPATTHSRSFAHLLDNPNASHRPYATYGYWGQSTGITDGDWTLLRDHEPSRAAAHLHTHHPRPIRLGGHRLERGYLGELSLGHLPGLDTPIWRMRHEPRRLGETPPHPDLLFHRIDDPEQEHDLIHDHPEVVTRLEQTLGRHLATLHAPDEITARLQTGSPMQ